MDLVVVRSGNVATLWVEISTFRNRFNGCKKWECCNLVGGNFHLNTAEEEKKDHPMTSRFPPFTINFTVAKGGNVASLNVDISILIKYRVVKKDHPMRS